MQEQIGATYSSSQYAKALCASEPKVGKTSYLVGSALGLMPWQKFGGIVSSPANLHVFAFDAGAVEIKSFLKKTLGASDEAMGYRVYNFQDDVRRVSTGKGDYDMTFYNTVMDALTTVRERAQSGGIHALVMSSLTGLAFGLERGIVGPPSGQGASGKGYADANKWQLLAAQIAEVRNFAQIDEWHCLWEAHIDKPPVLAQGRGSMEGEHSKESIHVSGKSGRNFSYNVEQVFRIRRQIGQVYEKTKCDLMYVDTRPAMDFIASGRAFTECLEPKEYDLTLALHKLGRRVGQWSKKAKKNG